MKEYVEKLIKEFTSYKDKDEYAVKYTVIESIITVYQQNLSIIFASNKGNRYFIDTYIPFEMTAKQFEEYYMMIDKEFLL